MIIDLLFFAQTAGEILDLIGVFVIVSGCILSSVLAGIDFFSKNSHHDNAYKTYRNNLGKSILLGLEFLVAGDIIRSISGNPDLSAVIILVIIVLVRSFLSITFEMEIDGKWPWQKNKSA
jgi:uncharacterized membrane protein